MLFPGRKLCMQIIRNVKQTSVNVKLCTLSLRPWNSAFVEQVWKLCWGQWSLWLCICLWWDCCAGLYKMYIHLQNTQSAELSLKDKPGCGGRENGEIEALELLLRIKILLQECSFCCRCFLARASQVRVFCANIVWHVIQLYNHDFSIAALMPVSQINIHILRSGEVPAEYNLKIDSCPVHRTGSQILFCDKGKRFTPCIKLFLPQYNVIQYM